jgi:hypothetical protein
MKNTTLGRKPSNDMVKNAGLVKPRRRSDQSGDGADFAFNGQMGDGVNRAPNRYAGNHSGQTMRENYGTGPARGNASSSPIDVGPGATHDAKQMTIATASQGGRIDGGAAVKKPANPDSIYMGK